MYKAMNEEGFDCEVVFRYEDVDYIYSLAVRNPPTGWVSCGEHIGLRVFDNGEVRKTFIAILANLKNYQYGNHMNIGYLNTGQWVYGIQIVVT